MNKLCIVVAALLFAIPCLAHAADFPSCSGVAALGGGQFLLVDDTKDNTANAARPRLRVSTLSPGNTAVSNVNEDWGDNAKPNDLESIAPIPGQPGSFLIAESAYHDGKYGRIFNVQLSQNGDSWSSHVAHVYQLPTFLRSDVEGIALAARPDGSLILVITERGGSGPYSPGWLWWGNFDLNSGEFTITEDATYGIQLNWPEQTYNPWARPCTDLFLDAGGYLWASGAQDMGDNGPFRSVIYRIGRFDPRQTYPIMYDYNQDLIWHVDGEKVEALGPAVVDGSILTYFTDDESFGGVWRPLPWDEPQKQQPYPYYGEGGM
jgi:hypothetical protein